MNISLISFYHRGCVDYDRDIDHGGTDFWCI